MTPCENGKDRSQPWGFSGRQGCQEAGTACAKCWCMWRLEHLPGMDRRPDCLRWPGRGQEDGPGWGRPMQTICSAEKLETNFKVGSQWRIFIRVPLPQFTLVLTFRVKCVSKVSSCYSFCLVNRVPFSGYYHSHQHHKESYLGLIMNTICSKRVGVRSAQWLSIWIWKSGSSGCAS